MAQQIATAEDVGPYIASKGVNRPEDAELLGRLVAAASQRAIRYTGRTFFPDPAFYDPDDPVTDTRPMVTKTFKVRNSPYVTMPDLRQVGTVTFGGLALTLDEGYELWGRDGEPATAIKILGPAMTAYMNVPPYNVLSVTGRWGWSEIPEDLRDAVCQWAARAFKKKDANYADTVVQGDGGAFMYLNNLPDDIKRTLNDFRVTAARVAIV